MSALERIHRGRRPPPLMTLDDRLELITETLTDVQGAADANGATLEEIAGAAETNGDKLADILGVLEDIRDTLMAIHDRQVRDD